MLMVFCRMVLTVLKVIIRAQWRNAKLMVNDQRDGPHPVLEIKVFKSWIERNSKQEERLGSSLRGEILFY